MAGGSFFALFDDIATILDDVTLMTKVAATKTAGVLGDDLALNAQQVVGVRADRELPVVWAVAKGSLRNKVILVPSALVISALIPWLVLPLLMVGGAFLCFEGFEKLVHSLLKRKEDADRHHAELVKAVSDPEIDMVAYEKEKVAGAIRTDFVLSAEIITITLGTVATAAFGKQVAVLVAIALIMTVGVYGLVAGIVKLDDGGLYLSRLSGLSAWHRMLRSLGHVMLGMAPALMKSLSTIGTVAMFLVGGGILVHGIPAAHDVIHHVTELGGAVPGVGGAVKSLIGLGLNIVAGIAVGAGAWAIINAFTRAATILRSRSQE
jgi:predicted DNA repair protein MutK